MLGRLLGHSPGLWQRVARPALCPTRAAGSRAKNAQDMALQTADPGKEAFRNERRPTNFDKKVLVWSGRFRKEEDIPRHISSEVLDTARNIVRIKICYIMIALSVLGCVAMIIRGKETKCRNKVEDCMVYGTWTFCLMSQCSSHISQATEVSDIPAEHSYSRSDFLVDLAGVASSRIPRIGYPGLEGWLEALIIHVLFGDVSKPGRKPEIVQDIETIYGKQFPFDEIASVVQKLDAILCLSSLTSTNSQLDTSPQMIASFVRVLLLPFPLILPYQLHICSATCEMELMCRQYLFIWGKDCFENEGD
ncbi:hypothetical protein TURU_155432 [Turdus rufiventris]|nr:hypothetical protein TURU_155432 [Turdus rufiventris]